MTIDKQQEMTCENNDSAFCTVTVNQIIHLCMFYLICICLIIILGTEIRAFQADVVKVMTS